MTFKRFIRYIHLVLGLSSGIVVFIVAITGCIYVFQKEIQDLTQSEYRFVRMQNGALLPPSILREKADAALPGKHPHSVYYAGKERSAFVVYYSEEPSYYDIVFLNPYSGEVLKVKDMLWDFFSIVLALHYTLLLPDDIGTTIVGYATLIFVVMLITGLILWWPKKNAVKQRFTIKWNVRWRRRNYDLHNVLGFYMTWIVIFIALTGLVWAFKWFENAVYWASSGGKSRVEYYEPHSDTTRVALLASTEAVDQVWHKVMLEAPAAQLVEIHFPDEAHAPIAASVNPSLSTYYQTDYRYFDQYTLQEMEVTHVWGRYRDADAAGLLKRMNYDIHVGAILGLPGQFLAFFAGLIAASLPITGFMVWLGRGKAKKEKREPAVAAVQRARQIASKDEEVMV